MDVYLKIADDIKAGVAKIICDAIFDDIAEFGAVDMKKLNKLMAKSHLQTLRSLTQFERCWSVIDSHLALYTEVEKLREQVKVRDIMITNRR